MTGFGEATGPVEGMTVRIEVRSVNNRHLKLQIRAPESMASAETELDRLLRRRVHRGTVSVNVRVDRGPEDLQERINPATLDAYLKPLLRAIESQANPSRLTIDLGGLVRLPGVIEEAAPEAGEADALREGVLSLATSALDQFEADRGREGAAMAEHLRAVLGEIRRAATEIAGRKETVVASYRDKLLERVGAWLAESQLAIEPKDVMREVALFADRADITEEIVRLNAHIDQFEHMLAHEDHPGRPLEFLLQEMGRETNTIGSKANDLTISQRVVDLKRNLETIREIVQNIE